MLLWNMHIIFICTYIQCLFMPAVTSNHLQLKWRIVDLFIDSRWDGDVFNLAGWFWILSYYRMNLRTSNIRSKILISARRYWQIETWDDRWGYKRLKNWRRLVFFEGGKSSNVLGEASGSARLLLGSSQLRTEIELCPWSKRILIQPFYWFQVANIITIPCYYYRYRWWRKRLRPWQKMHRLYWIFRKYCDNVDAVGHSFSNFQP